MDVGGWLPWTSMSGPTRRGPQNQAGAPLATCGDTRVSRQPGGRQAVQPRNYSQAVASVLPAAPVSPFMHRRHEPRGDTLRCGDPGRVFRGPWRTLAARALNIHPSAFVAGRSRRSTLKTDLPGEASRVQNRPPSSVRSTRSRSPRASRVTSILGTPRRSSPALTSRRPPTGIGPGVPSSRLKA